MKTPSPGVQTSSEVLVGPIGKTRMRSFQSSKRTGSMDVELLDGKVLIRAKAAICLRGRVVGPAGEVTGAFRKFRFKPETNTASGFPSETRLQTAADRP